MSEHSVDISTNGNVQIHRDRDDFLVAVGAPRLRDNAPFSAIDALALAKTDRSFFGTHLSGQYAVVAYFRKEIVAVCDPLGVHTLFYGHKSKGFKLTTRLESVPDISDINQEYIADFIANGVPCTALTPDRKVSRLRPFQYLSWNRGQGAVVHDRPTEPLISPINRSAEFLAKYGNKVISNVLQRHVTDFTGLGFELSGGLDSSTLYFSARRLLRDKDPIPKAVSILDGTSSTDSDDSVIETLSEQIPLLNPIQSHVLWDRPTPLPSLSEPFGFIFNRFYSNYELQLRKAGIRCLVSGLGGDQIFGSIETEPFYLSDLLRQRKIRELVKETRLWAQEHPGRGPTSYWMWYFALMPKFASLQTVKERLAGRPALSQLWFDRNWLRAFSVGGRRARSVARFGATTEQAALIDELCRLAASVSGYMQNNNACYRLYPYLDWETVKWFLALPQTCRRTPNSTRVIQREMIKDVVPDFIRLRTDKGTNQQSIEKGLSHSGLFQTLRQANSPLYDLGIVERKQWLAEIDRAEAGVFRDMATFISTASVDLWIRHLDRSAA